MYRVNIGDLLKLSDVSSISAAGQFDRCLSPFHLSQDRIEQLQNTDKSYIYPLCNTYELFSNILFSSEGVNIQPEECCTSRPARSSNMNAAFF